MIMKNNSYFIKYFLSIFLLFYFMFQPISPSLIIITSSNSDVTDRLIRLEALTEKQNHRLGFLELKTQDQETKIQVLEFKIGYLLEENSSSDDVIAAMNNNNKLSTGIEALRSKRPARLMPLSILVGKPKNKTVNPLPLNCNDLNDLGHTLNGFYLVKGKNRGKIEVTFCNFQNENERKKPEPDKMYGYLDVKTSPVHFHVARNGTMKSVSVKEVVRFNLAHLNVGKGMKLRLSVVMELSVVVNIESILKLKVGDEIDVYKTEGYFNDDDLGVTHFIGFLLEEDFNF